MQKSTEELIAQNRKTNDKDFLLFLNCDFKVFGARVSVVRVKAISVNNIDIYDLEVENIVTSPGIFMAFNKDLPYYDEPITECEYLGGKEFKINGEIYEMINTDAYYFVGDFNADEEKAENSLVECLVNWYKNKMEK